ncbi:hypothetical protein BS17DRAFT_501555 [Gyrodon lividus]|nr:hypothetical protein BS17DRAFT_501555 [Gyrodon lividus]
MKSQVDAETLSPGYVAIQVSTDRHLVRCMEVSSLALALWDYLLTMEDERRLIWPSRWSLVKCLFLLNRYGNILCQGFYIAADSGGVFQPSKSYCFRLACFQSVYRFVSCTSVYALTFIRALAIRRRSRRSTYILVGCFLLYEVYCLALQIDNLIVTKPGLVSIEYQTCVSTVSKTFRNPSWLVKGGSTVMDLGILVLNTTNLSRLFPKTCQESYPPLVRALYRGSLIFFFADMSGITLNIVLQQQSTLLFGS